MKISCLTAPLCLALLLASCTSRRRESPQVRLPSPTPTAVTEAEVGKLQSFERRVTFRRSREFLWQEVMPAMPFYEDDGVQTLQQATADINLRNGSELHLGETTLVILSADLLQAGTALDRAVLKAGEIAGRTSGELWILSAAALLKLRPRTGKQIAKANVRMDATKKKLNVQLIEGTAHAAVRSPSSTSAPRVIEIEQEKDTVIEAADTSEETLDWRAAGTERLIAAVSAPLPSRPPEPKRETTAISPTKPVEVKILSPANYAEIAARSVLIKGKLTGKGAGVTLNGKPVSVNDAGAFAHQVQLERGVNTFLIAVNRPKAEPVLKRWVVIRTD